MEGKNGSSIHCFCTGILRTAIGRKETEMITDAAFERTVAQVVADMVFSWTKYYVENCTKSGIPCISMRAHR